MRFRTVFALSWLVTLAPSALLADHVVLYRDANFSGPSLVIPVGDSHARLYDARGTAGMGWHNRASSLRVVGDVQARLFRDERFRGPVVVVTEDIRNLSAVRQNGRVHRLNDAISSIRVERRPFADGRPGAGHNRPGDGYGRPERPSGGLGDNPRQGAIVYRHSNFQGDSLILREGQSVANLRRTGSGLNMNDAISSMRISPGTAVILFEDAHYRGRAYRITNTTRALGRFNDVATSIRVVDSRYGRPGGGHGVGHGGGHGHDDDYCPDEGYAGGHNRGARVVFYRDRGFRGPSFTVRVDGAVSNLSRLRMYQGRNWDDEISSFRIYGNLHVALFPSRGFNGRPILAVDSVSDLRRFQGRHGRVNFNDNASSIRVLRADRWGNDGYGYHNTGGSHSNWTWTWNDSTWRSHHGYHYDDRWHWHDGHRHGRHRHDDDWEDAALVAAAVVGAAIIIPEVVDAFDGDDSTVPFGTSSNTAPARPQAPTADALVVLYSGPGFTGERLELRPGDQIGDLAREGSSVAWDNAISSVRVEGNARLVLFDDALFYGSSRVVTTSQSTLGGGFDNRASSLLVSVQ